jgi:hypothetical protein
LSSKHATAHFHASGRPIIDGYDPREGWGWCYVDEDLPHAHPTRSPQAIIPIIKSHSIVSPQMCSIQSKGDLVMSKILTTATAVIMLGVAATGVAQGRPINHQRHHFHAGYVSPVYSKA